MSRTKDHRIIKVEREWEYWGKMEKKKSIRKVTMAGKLGEN